jgi:hypothetical protein
MIQGFGHTPVDKRPKITLGPKYSPESSLYRCIVVPEKPYGVYLGAVEEQANLRGVKAGDIVKVRL